MMTLTLTLVLLATATALLVAKYEGQRKRHAMFNVWLTETWVETAALRAESLMDRR